MKATFFDKEVNYNRMTRMVSRLKIDFDELVVAVGDPHHMRHQEAHWLFSFCGIKFELVYDKSVKNPSKYCEVISTSMILDTIKFLIKLCIEKDSGPRYRSTIRQVFLLSSAASNP